MHDIYVVTITMLMPGSPSGMISDLFEFASTDSGAADKFFKDLVLTPTYFRKEMWLIRANGRRTLIKEERYKDGTV